MRSVLAFADTCYECLLLYTGTPDLYRGFGFRLLNEHGFSGRLRITRNDRAAPSAQCLSVREPQDVALIRRLFGTRSPVSDRLGLNDNEGVFFGNLLLQPGFRLSYLPRSDALIVWDRDGLGGRARLLDIVSAVLPPMDDLGVALGLMQLDETIDVLFPPDRLLGDFTATVFEHPDGDRLMVRGPFDIEDEPFMLPLTAVS
jgi:hypothetical protein